MSCAASFKVKCWEFFKACNGGEPITVTQLNGFIQKACPKWKGDNAEIIAMFLACDTNMDGVITWDEMKVALFKRNPKAVTIAELESLFKEKDTDGNGKLSKDEIKELAPDNMTDEKLDELFEICDANKDGVIEWDEFLAAWTQML